MSNSEKWIYELLEQEHTAPSDILEHLNGVEPLEIDVNSYGGRVDAGNEIYTALRAYAGHVTVNVIMAGSAASIIAMSADTVRMSPVGQIMIHNVSMGAAGDYKDMEKAGEILQKANESLANAYIQKTNLPKSKILELMNAETWLTADEAIEKGFADSMMFEDDRVPLNLIANGGHLLAPTIVQKMQSLKNEAKQKQLEETKDTSKKRTQEREK
ncbi:head maturation protease, ClpP-related [Listeria fleischmannii]|uniref:ATP-dependent Clp protease proteolytic subunit n=1 Tax=Listeria fleischmannii FSL S10-1203 TaxID=1265822 RepID=W7DQD9_9LIST|nr:head maturation protease, ClpP-related [Listeria fleischmannii]EUJ59548.1 Clp protease [Listeria fleischmannii FSL S10-1203]